MSLIPVKLEGAGPAPAPPAKRKKKMGTDAAAKTRRRAMISSIIIGSVIVHAIALLLFGLWTVAQYWSRPEARFEMKKVVKIPPKTPEHKMNVAKHEAMAPKPVFNDKLVSLRPADFALPELPQVDLNQMLPLDPSELISDQVSGLVGTAGLGTGLGGGLGGGGGTGKGMSFFGLRAEGERILLLFDVSTSVVNKAEKTGIPLTRIREETQKLIDGLPVTSSFSMIQFTGNYKPFGAELVAATDANKKNAKEWVEQEWVESGSMSAASSGVVSNLHGLIGVLERGFAMRPDVIFLISDASFQWRPTGEGMSNIPYDAIEKTLRKLQDESTKQVPIQMIAFTPKPDDAKEWSRIVRRYGGEFQEMEEE